MSARDLIDVTEGKSPQSVVEAITSDQKIQRERTFKKLMVVLTQERDFGIFDKATYKDLQKKIRKALGI